MKTFTKKTTKIILFILALPIIAIMFFLLFACVHTAELFEAYNKEDDNE